MTALQDWLSFSPVDPRTITGAIRDAWRGLTTDDAAPTDEPQLMGRGLERC
ncbi:hypothetical protein ACAG24_017855 [Mycobacterium sp. pW049]|uniref:hypothetical protein n=1 Tax=[Mycobacterium] bulgaricum TaxID=3238985 RepID=UPI00351B417F